MANLKGLVQVFGNASLSIKLVFLMILSDHFEKWCLSAICEGSNSFNASYMICLNFGLRIFGGGLQNDYVCGYVKMMNFGVLG